MHKDNLFTSSFIHSSTITTSSCSGTWWIRSLNTGCILLAWFVKSHISRLMEVVSSRMTPPTSTGHIRGLTYTQPLGLTEWFNEDDVNHLLWPSHSPASNVTGRICSNVFLKSALQHHYHNTNRANIWSMSSQNKPFWQHAVAQHLTNKLESCCFFLL